MASRSLGVAQVPSLTGGSPNPDVGTESVWGALTRFGARKS